MIKNDKSDVSNEIKQTTKEFEKKLQAQIKDL